MLKGPVFAMTALVLAFVPAPRAEAEEVEHPIYKSWARFPVGTSITLRSITEREDQSGRITSTIRQTLTRLEDARVVLEEVTTSDSGGEELTYPPREVTHRRMFPLLPTVKREDIGKPSGAIASGEETLEAAGGPIPTSWFDSKGRVEAGETFTRTWMSDEVPGRLVKTITRVPAAQSRSSVELIEIKTP